MMAVRKQGVGCCSRCYWSAFSPSLSLPRVGISCSHWQLPILSARCLNSSTRALCTPLWELPLLVQSSLEVWVLLLASDLSFQPSASEGPESENKRPFTPFVFGTVVRYITHVSLESPRGDWVPAVTAPYHSLHWLSHLFSHIFLSS